MQQNLTCIFEIMSVNRFKDRIIRGKSLGLAALMFSLNSLNITCNAVYVHQSLLQSYKCLLQYSSICWTKSAVRHELSDTG